MKLTNYKTHFNAQKQRSSIKNWPISKKKQAGSKVRLLDVCSNKLGTRRRWMLMIRWLGLSLTDWKVLNSIQLVFGTWKSSTSWLILATLHLKNLCLLQKHGVLLETVTVFKKNMRLHLSSSIEPSSWTKISHMLIRFVVMSMFQMKILKMQKNVIEPH